MLALLHLEILQIRAYADRDVWRPEGKPDRFRDYLILESAATEIMIYDPQQIPELLRRPD